MQASKLFLLSLSILLLSCRDQHLKFHGSQYPKKANAPFSDAVSVGNTIYLSGQLGMDHHSRKLVPGGIKAQTKQAIENISEVLQLHDSSLDQVVSCTVILADMSDFSAFNEVYRGYFKNKPARTTFAASGLARNAKVEIACVAIKK
jgi:2-iminobutanoate/2-iminopropanoate deaminase